MMKILHFYKTYYPDSFGGIEQVIFQLSENGLKHDIQSTVFSLTEKETDLNGIVSSHRSVKVHSDFTIASSPFSFSALKVFKQLASECDVIHYHFPWPFMDMVHFMAGIKKPTIVSYHSDIVRQKKLLYLYSPLMHKFMSSVDVIVATSPNYVATSCILKQHIDKVKVIPIGIERDFYPAASVTKIDSWRKKLPPKFFLFIGTLRYYKGLHILLSANATRDYPIVIIGSGPIEQELRKQASELKLENIIFLGALDNEDKIAILELCHAMVFPSHLRSEAFGISLLEGALFKKPLISSEIGTGTTYINIDKLTGLVVPPGDPAALREAMDRLWNDPEYAQQLGQGAHIRFEALFTADKMIESYTELYKSLLSV